jgi:general secretion pathway protein D
LQARGTSNRVDPLSCPGSTTLDNRLAEIVVGQNVPFRTGSFAADGNATTPCFSIESHDVGITLRALPRETQGDVIQLDRSQQVFSPTSRTVAGAACWMGKNASGGCLSTSEGCLMSGLCRDCLRWLA